MHQETCLLYDSHCFFMITLLEVTKSLSKTFCSLMFKNVVERMNTNRLERLGEVKAFYVWDQKWTKQDFLEAVASPLGRWGVTYWKREGKLFWTEGSEIDGWYSSVERVSRKDFESPMSTHEFLLHSCHHCASHIPSVSNLPSILGFCNMPGQNRGLLDSRTMKGKTDIKLVITEMITFC